MWEASPYTLRFDKALLQRIGFRKRARLTINWSMVSYPEYVGKQLFGLTYQQLTDLEVACFATVNGEELLLLQAIWFGWPDPPEWGLIGRIADETQWQDWGRFSEVPVNWTLPVGIS